MMATTVRKKGSIKTIKDGSKKLAKEAAYSPLVDRLARLGYAVKGLIYITIGIIAFQGALGKSATPADQLGAIAAMRKLPNAGIVLWLILIGLIAYSIWGIIRAVFDPFHKGNNTMGLLTRGGYLASAFTYGVLVIPTYDLIRGTATGSQTGRTQKFIASLMSMSLGPLLVSIFGLGMAGAGLYQIYMGFSSNFEKRFKPYALSPKQLRIAIQVGRFGTVARGIVLAIVGYFFVLAGYHANPSHAGTFAGALRFLAQQPYGLWLLGIVAAGLIAFGLYSIMSAAWFKLAR